MAIDPLSGDQVRLPIPFLISRRDAVCRPWAAEGFRAVARIVCGAASAAMLVGEG
jgi:hypothetical protein